MELINSKVARAGIEARAGRRWEAVDAIQQAESRLHRSKMMGVVTRGKMGLAPFQPSHCQKEQEELPSSGEDESRGREVIQDSVSRAAGHLNKVR